MFTDSIGLLIVNIYSGGYRINLIVAFQFCPQQTHTRQPQDMRLPLMMHKQHVTKQ